jgi:hypothetical protein
MGLDHQVGRHDAQIEALEREVHALRADIAEIKRMLSEAHGGWKALMLVAGIAATIGAAATKLATWVGWVPR